MSKNMVLTWEMLKKKKHGYFNGIFPKNIVILWCMSMGKMCYYHRNLSKNMILLWDMSKNMVILWCMFKKHGISISTLG